MLLGYLISIASFLAPEPSLPLLNPLSHPLFSYLLSFSFPLKRGNAHRWASWIRMVFLWAFWMFRRSEVELHKPSGSTSLIVMCAVLCLIAQSYLTLCNPMDYSPPGSSVHGDSPGKNTGVGCHALLQGIFPSQGSNPGLLHCRRILYQLSHKESWYLTCPTKYLCYLSLIM